MRIVNWIFRGIIFAILIWCLRETLSRKMDASDFILSITAGAIFLYTFETYLTRREMHIFHELGIKPKLTAYITGGKFIIHNEGHGTVTNIKVKRLEVKRLEVKSSRWKAYFIFKEIDAIEKGLGKYLEIIAEYYNGEWVPLGTINRKTTSWLAETYELEITFKSLSGKKYSEKVKCELKL